MISILQKLNFPFGRKKKFEIISPEKLLENSKNVLVLIPEEIELIEDIKFLIEEFPKHMGRCTFLIEEKIYTNIDSLPECPIIVYTQKQKNLFKMPSKNLITLLNIKNFDLIIDCNLSESNFHYWISKNLNAKYKVSLFRKNSTLFNNLVIKLRNVNNTREAYEKYLQILNL